MKRIAILAISSVLCACAARATFSFTLSDGTVVTSGGDADGQVNNAGFVSLGDSQWSLTMDLLGLSPGNHAIIAGAGDFQIARVATGVTYMASLGGWCNVWLDAHGSSNGSPVTGHFTCKGLVSMNGDKMDVTSGSFDVPINDPANNPLHK